MILLAIMTLAPLVVWAATISVTTSVDEVNNDGDCSLREAIIAANTDTTVDACPAGNEADTIILPAGNYVLTIAGTGEDAAQTGDLDITETLIITGSGPFNTTVDANDIDRVFHLVSADVVQISGVTIRDGDSGTRHGGGISVDSGELTLTNSRINSNTAERGGGIFVDRDANLIVIASRLTNNTAETGGGLYLVGSTAEVVNSIVAGNSVSGSALGSSGGGLRSASSAILTLINSTVSGNSATLHGGGIHSDNETHLYNVTITNNIADSDSADGGDGGGVHIDEPNGLLTARNSLIGGNVDNSGEAPDCADEFTGEGYNLIEDLTGCIVFGDSTGNITGLDPGLGPLQNNGGPTFTHALLPGSPAIDAGNPAGCLDPNSLPLTIDQRGFARPVDGGSGSARCDMGAYEFNSPGVPTPTATPAPTATPDSAPPADHLVYLPLIRK